MMVKFVPLKVVGMPQHIGDTVAFLVKPGWRNKSGYFPKYKNFT